MNFTGFMFRVDIMHQIILPVNFIQLLKIERFTMSYAKKMFRLGVYFVFVFVFFLGLVFKEILIFPCKSTMC